MTRSKSFVHTSGFWLTAAIMVAGGILLTIARPASELALAQAWMIPVGYGLAGFGATIMFVLWVMHNAR